MSDALPLPPRPDLNQYRTLAKNLQRAANSGAADAVRLWARRWLDVLARLRGEDVSLGEAARVREAARMAGRWTALGETHGRGARCRLSDAQFHLAREHGFASWPAFVAHVEALTDARTPTARFESAVDAIVRGDVAALRALLRDHPELAQARSTRDHDSTLLHYVSANGVEDFRQQTPPSIVEIAKMLIDAGADVNAVSEAYGGGSTTLGLVATSIHPEQAGVQIALLEVLMSHGARMDQPGLAGNQHSAVWGCLANGQLEAARFFAERGVRLSLEEAAGIGRLETVRTFFSADGALAPEVTAAEAASALRYASGYGQRDVVRYLLERGFDPAAADSDGQTALHWSTLGPHVGVARLLLARGADVSVRDGTHHATPLDWALFALIKAKDAEERDGSVEMIALLIGAGATLDVASLDPRLIEILCADPRLRTIVDGQ